MDSVTYSLLCFLTQKNVKKKKNVEIFFLAQSLFKNKPQAGSGQHATASLVESSYQINSYIPGMRGCVLCSGEEATSGTEAAGGVAT